MKAKEPRISVRVPQHLKARLEAAAAKIRVNEADLVKQCVEAFCDYAEANERVPLPAVFDDGKKKGCASSPPPAPSARTGINYGEHKADSLALNEPKPRRKA